MMRLTLVQEQDLSEVLSARRFCLDAPFDPAVRYMAPHYDLLDGTRSQLDSAMSWSLVGRLCWLEVRVHQTSTSVPLRDHLLKVAPQQVRWEEGKPACKQEATWVFASLMRDTRKKAALPVLNSVLSTVCPPNLSHEQKLQRLSDMGEGVANACHTLVDWGAAGWSARGAWLDVLASFLNGVAHPAIELANASSPYARLVAALSTLVTANTSVDTRQELRDAVLASALKGWEAFLDLGRATSHDTLSPAPQARLFALEAPEPGGVSNPLRETLEGLVENALCIHEGRGVAKVWEKSSQVGAVALATLWRLENASDLTLRQWSQQGRLDSFKNLSDPHHDNYPRMLDLYLSIQSRNSNTAAPPRPRM